jgi:hypothetical protein
MVSLMKKIIIMYLLSLYILYTYFIFIYGFTLGIYHLKMITENEIIYIIYLLYFFFVYFGLISLLVIKVFW